MCSRINDKDPKSFQLQIIAIERISWQVDASWGLVHKGVDIRFQHILHGVQEKNVKYLM